MKVGLFGLGTVGGGVAELLLKEKKIKDCGIELKKIVVRDPQRKRDVKVPPSLLGKDPRLILKDPEIDTVVEVIGGFFPAKEIVLEALDRGKNVVTANKLLLAREGNLIFKKAREKNCSLGIRAANIAGYRLLESLANSPSRIEKIVGVLNGTSNFILTEMEKRKVDLKVALEKARLKGYTEEDPSEDVDGWDTLHKLLIMLSLDIGYFFPWEKIWVEGIRKISLNDILFARELGYRIKLLGIVKREDGDLEIRVHPALIPQEKSLARLEGVENGVEIRDELGVGAEIQAPGAGRYPTATAIMEDLISISRGRRFPLPSPPSPSPHLKPMEEIETKYYLRFEAIDRAGVLAKISGVLGEYNISIKAVIQKERENSEVVPVIMLTHRAKEKSLREALQKISNLPVVKEEPLLIRVEEDLF